MTYAVCPACDRHWTPPGPCDNTVDGEPCGYVLDPPPRVPRKRATDDHLTEPDRFRLHQLTDQDRARNLAGIAAARQALKDIR